MSDLIVKGKIDEVSKKEKSYKVIIGGKNYYCHDDLTDLVGKDIEAEYTLSEPYDYKGKQVQSKFLPERGKIAVVRGDVPIRPENPSNVPQNAKNGHCGEVAQPDWDSINAEKRRSIALSYSWGAVCDGIIKKEERFRFALEDTVFMQTGKPPEIDVPF